MDTNLYCCDTSNSVVLTRFDTTDQGQLLLACSNLLFASLPKSTDAASKDETLTLVYITHTVEISGQRLAKLLEPLQNGQAKRVYVGTEKAREAASGPVVRAVKFTLSQPEQTP